MAQSMPNWSSKSGSIRRGIALLITMPMAWVSSWSHTNITERLKRRSAIEGVAIRKRPTSEFLMNVIVLLKSLAV
jgi:hypothetical protein